MAAVLSDCFDPPSFSPLFWVTLQVLNRIVLQQEGLATEGMALRTVSVTLHHREHLVSLPSV